MDLYCYHIEVECNVEVANVIYYWMYISVSQMKCLTVCKRRRKINECDYKCEHKLVSAGNMLSFEG